MGARFPLGLAFKRALQWPLERWRALLPATILLALIDAVCFAGTLSAVHVDESGVLQMNTQSAPIALAALLVSSVSSLSYGLGLYRCVLLEEARPGFALFVLDRRLPRAVGLGIRMTGFGFVLVLLATLLSYVVGGGMTLPTLALFGYLTVAVPRLRLAFAATALDEANPTLRDAWSRTRGDAAAIIAGVVAIYLLLTVAQSVVSLVPLLGDDVPGFLLAGLFAALQSCVSVVFVALAYDALVRGGGPRGDATLH